jgi:RNA polymerase sigma factor (sigma-70 family)
VELPPFQRLIDDHWREVARLAHALAGPVDGDDVAQQAWLQAWSAYGQVRSAANLRSWLLTITSRCATDRHRRRAREPVPVAEPGETQASPPVPLGVDATDAAWQYVRTLPERQQQAVALRYVADFDHRMIAAALGTTPAASRRLLADAIATLRTTLLTASRDQPEET